MWKGKGGQQNGLQKLAQTLTNLNKQFCFGPDILVAIVNLRGDFLLELLEFVTRQSARQELGTPLHKLTHQPLDLLHTHPLVGLDK